MNIVAIDIGNTNITVGLFLDGVETSIESVPGSSKVKLEKALGIAWQQVPILESSTERKRNGFFVASSVKPKWTDLVREIIREKLDEKLFVTGKDIPLPMNVKVAEPKEVGTDRVVAAAAAYAVIEDAVVVADFGTAITIDLVDEKGTFLGGVICPGFEMSAEALNKKTAQLPKVKVSKPKLPYGTNTEEAINCGLYYSAIGTLEEVTRRYGEAVGKWPEIIVTGAGGKMIKDDCEFINAYVPNLVVRGIVLAFQKYSEDTMSSL